MSEKYVMQDKTPERLKALQDAIDPATFRRIKALGWLQAAIVGKLAQGAGRLPFGLLKKLAMTGNCSLRTSMLIMEGLLKLPNVTFLKHDVDKDDLPAGRFDLIHTRVVLMHGGIERAAVVRKLI